MMCINFFYLSSKFDFFYFSLSFLFFHFDCSVCRLYEKWTWNGRILKQFKLFNGFLFNSPSNSFFFSFVIIFFLSSFTPQWFIKFFSFLFFFYNSEVPKNNKRKNKCILPRVDLNISFSTLFKIYIFFLLPSSLITI